MIIKGTESVWSQRGKVGGRAASGAWPQSSPFCPVPLSPLGSCRGPRSRQLGGVERSKSSSFCSWETRPVMPESVSQNPHLSSVLPLVRFDPRKCWPLFRSLTVLNCPGGKWVDTKRKTVFHLVCLWEVLAGT